MSRVGRAGRVGRVGFACALLVSCAAIQGTSPSHAPLNLCPDHPCEAFKGGPAKAGCQNGRCEISGGLKSFTIVVAVPDTSFFAPGATFLVPSRELTSPGTPHPRCPPPNCLSLPDIGVVNGRYAADKASAAAVGLATASGLPSVPVRVAFVPLTAPGVEAIGQGLPAPITFASSRVLAEAVRYEEQLPAGRYLRICEPEAPWDKYLPPLYAEIVVHENATLLDDFLLETTTPTLDDPTGELRTATVTRATPNGPNPRAEGLPLDGFHMWIAEPKTGRRVSVVRPLRGTSAVLRFDTSGQTSTGKALREPLDMIIAPPDDWIGVPRYEAQISGGQSGLGKFDYPALLPPLQQNGVVVTENPSGTRLGIPSHVTFASQSITNPDGTPEPKLRYTTTVATDDSGRFTTVLPPGIYSALVDPAEGTGFSRFTQIVDLGKAQGTSLVAPKRARARGRARVADGRPLAGARVLAAPATPARLEAPSDLAPRAATTITNDAGEYEIDLDRGTFEIAIIPEPGTGLPRRVSIVPVDGDVIEVPDVEVPAPFKLAFTIREPGENAPPLAHAIVRIFAPIAGSPRLAEVGMGTTDAGGKCEILLAE